MKIRRANELTSDEQSNLANWAHEIGDRLRGEYRGRGGGRFDAYGICGSCGSFSHISTEFRTLHARCGQHEIVLTGKEPVRHCTTYTEKGRMSLWEMKEVAYIIDPDPKDNIGF